MKYGVGQCNNNNNHYVHPFTELVYKEVVDFKPKPSVIAEEVEKAQTVAAGGN